MFSHWVADFLCQTSWMAENKGKNFLALLSHGFVYTGMLAYMVMMLGGRMGMEYGAMALFIMIDQWTVPLGGRFFHQQAHVLFLEIWSSPQFLCRHRVRPIHSLRYTICDHVGVFDSLEAPEELLRLLEQLLQRGSLHRRWPVTGARGRSGHHCLTWEGSPVSTTEDATQTDRAGEQGCEVGLWQPKGQRKLR